MSNNFQTSSKRAVETTDVTKSFGWDSSEGTKKPDDFKIHVLAVVYSEIKVLPLKQMCTNCRVATVREKTGKFNRYLFSKI